MKSTALFASLAISAALSAETLSQTDFESAEIGKPFLRENWKKEGFTTGTWDNGLNDRTIIDTAYYVSNSKSLRVEYPQGGLGTSETGAQVELKFTPRDEAYMSYWMRFSDNFSFGTTSKGGKLPGLSGGKNCSGGDSCDGTNGFSARFMWRNEGQIVLYLYHMDKPAKWGEDHPLKYEDGSNVVFERGTWHHIGERVKINSSGDAYDGEVQAWVDGKEVLSLNGLRFTSNGDKVDKLYFSTFHGGNDQTWVPTETCYIWFDDIKIGTTREDVSNEETTRVQPVGPAEMPSDMFLVYRKGSKIIIVADNIIKEVVVLKANGKLKTFSDPRVIDNRWEFTLRSKEPLIIQVETIDGKKMKQKLVY